MKKIGYSVIISFLFLLEAIYAAPVLSINNNEVLIFRIILRQSDSYIAKTIYKSEEKDNSLYYSYIHYDKDATFDVLTRGNALPEKIIWKHANSSADFSFNGTGSVKLLLTDNKGIAEKTGMFMLSVSAENALIVRTLDPDRKEKYEFDLIQCDKLPELTAYRMYFQVVGDETVKVEAGKFRCKKVLFSLTGWRGMFYKAYYYISNDEHRYLVKMENMPEGGSSELIKIQ